MTTACKRGGRKHKRPKGPVALRPVADTSGTWRIITPAGVTVASELPSRQAAFHGAKLLQQAGFDPHDLLPVRNWQRVEART
jgi:hypothetical protein